MIKPLYPKSESTKSEKNPSSLTSQPFAFPDSVQSDLFNYLKPAQREAMRPYLRLIKRPYQEKLCTSLLDYLEGHGLDELQQPVLNRLQAHIIDACQLHPLTSRQPKSIGTVIRQLFGSLNPQH